MLGMRRTWAKQTLEISQMLLSIWGRQVSNFGWSTSQSASCYACCVLSVYVSKIKNTKTLVPSKITLFWMRYMNRYCIYICICICIIYSWILGHHICEIPWDKTKTAQGYIYYQNKPIYQNRSKQDLKRTNKQILKTVFPKWHLCTSKTVCQNASFFQSNYWMSNKRKLVEHTAFSCKMRLNNKTKNTAKQHVPTCSTSGSSSSSSSIAGFLGELDFRVTCSQPRDLTWSI